MPETRKTVAGKAKAGKAKPSPKKSKAAPKSKTGPKKQSAKKSAPASSPQNHLGAVADQQEEIRSFIQQQADINKTILERLQGLSDKCQSIPIVSGAGELRNGQSGEGANKVRAGVAKHSDVQILSEPGSSDEYDTEDDDQLTNDLMEANLLLQPKFTNTTGKSLSHRRKLELAIRTNRPFAFLERETQRSMVREGGHPEELPLILHIEGLVAMLASACSDARVKGLANHLLQVVRDVQVHSWSKIRKWSNEVVLNTAM